MYYNKIYNFIEDLSSSNIEESKTQLKKYVMELILSIRDYDNSMKLEELEYMLNIILTKEKLQSEVVKEAGFKLGMITNEFMNIYSEFINGIVENGYIENAITLTRNVIKGMGYTYIDVYLVKKNGGFAEENKYLKSVEFLNDLQEELRKYLNQDINNLQKEYFNILGLVEYIKSDLEESIIGIGNLLMFELRNKSLNDFHKETHICEYKSIFRPEYIEELNRRKYEWNILSSKLKESYYIDILYKNLD